MRVPHHDNKQAAIQVEIPTTSESLRRIDCKARKSNANPPRTNQLAMVSKLFVAHDSKNVEDMHEYRHKTTIQGEGSKN